MLASAFPVSAIKACALLMFSSSKLATERPSADVFFHQVGHRASVGIDDHHTVGIHQLDEFLAAMGIGLKYLGTHPAGQHVGNPYGSFATAHDKDILHIGIMALAHDVFQVGHKLPGGHEIGIVTVEEHVIARGDDGRRAALDGDDVVGRIGLKDVLEGLVENFATVPQLDAQQREQAAMHFPPLAGPGQFQTVDDVDGCQLVGIDDRRDAG